MTFQKKDSKGDRAINDRDKSDRLLIYVHYNPQKLLSDHVLFTLKEMAPFFKRTVFVSNSPISKKQKHDVQIVADKVIERENVGFDFAAWRDALKEESWESIGRYDSLTLMNDSCFGPLCDMGSVFNQMEVDEIDFWGITEHKEQTYHIPIIRRKRVAHLQSYFMCFNKKVIRSEVFQTFWTNVEDLRDKDDVIENYEIGLSEELHKAGLISKAYVIPNLASQEINDTAAFIRPDHIIQKGSPFVKVKGFFLFEHFRYLKKIVQDYTNYDFKLIEDHISKTFNPNTSLSIMGKNYILPEQQENKKSHNLKIIVHLHAYYTDISKWLNAFKKLDTRFDLFITTDTDAKKAQISELLSEYDLPVEASEVQIVENRGRDVLPWLKFADKLSAYDLVGHFHTKKSTFAPEWVGETWVGEIIDTLIDHAETIFKLFESDPELGIVIPDIPYYFKTNQRLLYEDEEQDSMLALWNKLDVQKSIKEEDLYAPVMGYGNMFWYRPPALEPLMKFNLFKNEFPEEPIPPKNTLAHQIERLPVYVAWSQNYDFKILLNQEAVFSGFDVENKYGINKVIKEFKQAPAWKIGRTITWMPGKIKRIIRNPIYKDGEAGDRL